MERIYFYLFVCFLWPPILIGQNTHLSSGENSLGKNYFIEHNPYLTPRGLTNSETRAIDSLAKFDEKAVRADLLNRGVFGSELEAHMLVLKRRYINQQFEIGEKPVYLKEPNPVFHDAYYTPTISLSRTIGGTNSISSAACGNEDFEATPAGIYNTATGVQGWTITSMTQNSCAYGPWTAGSTEFSIVTTPFSGFPGIGTVPNSPLGGSKVAWMGNLSSNYTRVKLSTNINVTAANALFQYAFAGYYVNGNHNCCDAPAFGSQIRDCNNNIIPCLTFSTTSNCNGVTTTYSPILAGTITIGGWTSWVVRSVDLSPFIGTCVTFECWSCDCTAGAHFGTSLFDARCGGQNIANGLNMVGNGVSPVNYCAGSGVAQLTAPSNYMAYNWVAPSGSPTISVTQATSQAITVNNPVSGSVYSVTLYSASGCTFLATSTLVATSVGISAGNSAPSCPLGSVGSATVQGTGSSVGYNYLWVNSSNSVVSTASVANNLAPGIYTVSLSAPNYSSCGTATNAVTIGTISPLVTNYVKPVCNGTAYISSNGGSNFQWYSGNAAISSPVGTASVLVINNPVVGSIYQLGRMYQGCRDSVIYTISTATPFPVSITTLSSSCVGTSLGSAIITMTPTPNAPPSTFSYSVITLPGASTTYSATFLNSPTNSYTAVNIPVSVQFNAIVFDGSCYSSSQGYVYPLAPAFDFTPGPVGGLVCQNSGATAGITFNFSTTPGQYNFLWLPNTFLAANNNTVQSPVILPQTAPGNFGSIVYTVVVTPSVANCPVTKTLSINYLNPITPSLSAVSPFCSNAQSATISANPSGGLFSCVGNGSLAPISANGGVITPSLTITGVNSFTYSLFTGSCVSSVSSTFLVNAAPNLSVIGNEGVCSGSAFTLTATGANTYSWNGVQNPPAFTGSAFTNTTFILTGLNTTNNCSATSVINLSVNPSPTLLINGNLSICAGQTSTIMVSGADGYLWNTNSASPLQFFYPSVTTQYTVTGTNSFGCVDTETIQVTVSNCNGIYEFQNNRLDLRFYPNPGSGIFMISCKLPVDIDLYNELGELILHNKHLLDNDELDISALSDGIYFVKCQSAGIITMSRLVKVK